MSAGERARPRGFRFAARRRAARARGWTARLLARSGPPNVNSRQPAAGADGALDMPPAPPRCPPGWRTGPPDFIGVGVQRCGSSRWFRLIAAHPDVVRVRAAKELHYFDRYYAGGFTAADVAGYHAYFPRSGDQTTGEWTPLYISAPWVPRLLAAAAPEARLLVLLRDPVERFRSALELNARVARKRGAPLSRYAPIEAFARGYYHAQLTALLRYFDRAQVLVLQYERCTREPVTELARTLRFLGLRDIDFAADLEEHPQRLAEKQPLAAEARAAYVGAYSDDVLRLIEDFPEIDIGLWPNFAHLADRPKVA